MHMKDDHMQNGQLKPGYNIQIGVEGEYIVGIDISSERSDQLTFIPFLDKLEKDLPMKMLSLTPATKVKKIICTYQNIIKNHT